MKMLHRMLAILSLLLVSLASHPASASVFNMGGTRDPATGQWTGLASLETVPVGDPTNPGNAADIAGRGSVRYTYDIGKYEVTTGQYCEFLNKVAGVDTYGLYSTKMWSSTFGCRIQRSGDGTTGNPYTYTVAADYANRPVNYVSFGDACRFANWLHNGQPSGAQSAATTEDGAYYLNGATTGATLLAVARKASWKWAVPSEDEWYKAAYYDPNKAGGAGYWLYPTGSNSVPDRDMNEGTQPGNNVNYWTTGYLIDSPYYRTQVGEFELSDSPYGTFDQGGNVWEWNEAVVFSTCRGVRGGSFDNAAGYLRSSGYYSDYGDSPTVEDYTVGFRVVQVPEPATLSLLVLGGLLVARRRRI